MIYGDRHIPLRSNSEQLELKSERFKNNNSKSDSFKNLQYYLFNGNTLEDKLFSYKKQKIDAFNFTQIYDQSLHKEKKSIPITRDFSQVFDAPNVMNFYFANILDAGRNNAFVVGLKDEAYVKSNMMETKMICKTHLDHITATKIGNQGSIAIGTENGNLFVYDNLLQQTLSISRTTDPINAIEIDQDVVYTVSDDGELRSYDLRIKNGIKDSVDLSHEVDTLVSIKLSPSRNTIVMGSDSGCIFITDIRMPDVDIIPTSSQGIVSIGWSNNENNVIYYASDDNSRVVKLSLFSGKVLDEIISDSKLTGLVLLEDYGMLVTSHGPSKDPVRVWDIKKKEQIGSLLPPHIDGEIPTQEIIGMVSNIENTKIYAVSTEEEISVWDISDIPKKKKELKYDTLFNLVK